MPLDDPTKEKRPKIRQKSEKIFIMVLCQFCKKKSRNAIGIIRYCEMQAIFLNLSKTKSEKMF